MADEIQFMYHILLKKKLQIVSYRARIRGFSENCLHCFSGGCRRRGVAPAYQKLVLTNNVSSAEVEFLCQSEVLFCVLQIVIISIKFRYLPRDGFNRDVGLINGFDCFYSIKNSIFNQK
jgi:hypothetical protein